LKSIARYEAAAGRAELVSVSLGGPDATKAKLAQIGASPRRLWFALDRDADVLIALGGPPPRLPLAVAINALGRVCGRRAGLLGTETVKQWVAKCSS
jgi:hypothetical protein